MFNVMKANVDVGTINNRYNIKEINTLSTSYMNSTTNAGQDVLANKQIDSEVFLHVLKSKPKIDIVHFSKSAGDIAISVRQEDILSEKYLKEKNFIIRTKFFANFIGELLVRQNIEKFINLLVKIDANSYNKVVCGFNHRNFGMSSCDRNNAFKFQFHISLIQDILTEDINRMIKLEQ
jgi:hypothetical protein